MKEYIYLGKIVNTHGIKGEIRIQSDFLRKELVFLPNFSLYIGKNKTIEKIETYRVHKGYDMVTLQGISNINDVLKYKGQNVFIKREELGLSKEEYLLEDLIGFKVIENQKILGIIKDFMYNKGNILLEIAGDKKFYLPYNEVFIEKVFLLKQEVQVKNTKGLIL